MADEMEQIEARLAAYIDGTLPAAQRAEIEAYLKANPAHAKLISELVSLKSALAAFPREKAPAEVLDALQSQIERHALLDADEAGDTPSMRITRWPAFGSAAAVLLLAAGLGLLVYQVLPRPKSDLAMLSTTKPGEVSLSTDGAVGGGGAMGGGAMGGGASADAPMVRREKRSELSAKDELAAAPAVPAPGATPPATPAPRADRSAAPRTRQADTNEPAEMATQAPQQNRFSNNLPSQNGPGGTMMMAGQSVYFAAAPTSGVVSDPVRVVVVRTDDPALTQNLLVGSLVADKTAFELADWPTTLPTSAPTTTRPSIGEVIKNLRDGGWLAVSQRGPESGQALILRDVTQTQTLGLMNTINRQRPGRQEARFAHDPPRDIAVAPSTRPTEQRDDDIKLMLPDATPPATAPTTLHAEVVMVTDNVVSLRPTTAPATRPTTTPYGYTPSDLIVFVVPRPEPAITPATRATTLPELLPPLSPSTAPASRP